MDPTKLSTEKIKQNIIAPTIINSKSNFVVVTYWWGRGNLNYNTGRPCLTSVKKTKKFTKKPLTYDKMITRWEDSCIKNKCNYMAIEYPEYAKKGMYQAAINFKSQFILIALNACKPRSVLYLDGDMLIKKYPHIFDMKNVDFMARGWNADARDAPTHLDRLLFDPYVFETGGAVMYFSNTEQSKDLLVIWDKFNQKNIGKSDDRNLSYIFNVKKKLLDCRIVQLPIEYLWLTLAYQKDFPQLKSLKKILEHPDCLTEEDMASSLGSDKNRLPRNYKRNVENKVNNDDIYSRYDIPRNKIFFEYIFFESINAMKELQDYITSLKRYKVLVISYSDKYGPFNNVARVNSTLSKEFKFKPNELIILVESKRNIKNEYIINRDELFPAILAAMLVNSTVLYISDETKLKYLKHFYEIDNDLVLKNKNKEIKRYVYDYFLVIDTNYPIFFGICQPLYHLVKISNCLESFEYNFNSNFDFISRISCRWI